MIDHLLGHYSRDTLHHFYLLTAPQAITAPQAYLEEWVKLFFERLEQKEALVLENLSDLLILRPAQKGQAYTVEHPGLEEWAKTTDYRPLKWKRRFVVVFEAHLMPPVVQNKLLKTLEEPHPEHCIFWLRPWASSLLPTIESRAQTLSLTLDSAITADGAPWPLKYQRAEATSLLDDSLRTVLEQGQWHLLMDKLKENPGLAHELREVLLSEELSKDQGLMRKAKTLQALKWFEESAQFNNYEAERWCQLLTALKS